MTFLIVLLTTLVSGQTLKQKLERSLRTPSDRAWRQKDVNFADSDTGRKKWAKAISEDDWRNAILGPKDVHALKGFISASNCVFYDEIRNTVVGAKPDRILISAPDCGNGEKGQPLVMCASRVQCSMPGMTSVFIARCLAESGACPDAKACALKSDWEIKLMEDDKAVYQNIWIGGQSVRKIK